MLVVAQIGKYDDSTTQGVADSSVFGRVNSMFTPWELVAKCSILVCDSKTNRLPSIGVCVQRQTRFLFVPQYSLVVAILPSIINIIRF